MSSRLPTASTTKGAIDALNEGLTLDYRQVKSLADSFCDGYNLGHVSFGISTGRIEPEDLISKMEPSKTKTPGFLFLLSYLIKNGLDVNYYIPVYGIVNTKIHIAAFLATRMSTSKYSEYVYDLLKTAGSSFLSIAYTGSQNKNNETVQDVIRERSPGKLNIADQNFSLTELLGDGDFSIKWDIFKEILLDHKYTDNKTDVLDFLSDVEINKRFVTRSIVNYLTSRAFSINCIRETSDRELILNTTGNMSESVYFAIISENLEYFKIIIDKGAECDYLCITELISRHNEASQKKDKILVKIFGDMIEHAISSGSEIDNHQIQFLSLHASIELIENIRSNYREPEWKKLCSRVSPGEKNQIPVKRLRQIAFDLNLDFSMSPSFICDKLGQISNMDRVQFAKDAIERQTERVERILMEAGKIREGDLIERRRCNTKSMIINNPYAYNDARMAFYKDDDGELWCFTSDFFESMIESTKNPYTGKKLPTLFLETIKTQFNILKFLDLARPSDNINMGEAINKVFDNKKEINNDQSEDIYVRAINILRLLGLKYGNSFMAEHDIRQRSLANKNIIFDKFLNLTLYFAVNAENQIELDFVKDNLFIQDIVPLRGSDSISSYSQTISFKYKSRFKVIDVFRKAKYMENIPKSGFNELFFRLVTYHIFTFYNNFEKGERAGVHYYTEGTSADSLVRIYGKLME